MNLSPHSKEHPDPASKIRFKQQIFASIGGGMIFALVGVITAKLLAPIGAAQGAAAAGATAATAATAGGILMPALGIAAVAAIGLACVYFAAKYLSKAVSLDQETQAEKISEATLGRGLALAPTIEPAKPMSVPFAVTDQHAVDISEKDAPGTMLSDVAYHNKILMPHGEKITLH